MELLGVFSGPGFHWFAPNGDEVHNVTIAFVTREFEGELRADGEEGVEVKFIDLNALPENLGPPAEPVITFFKKNRDAFLK